MERKVARERTTKETQIKLTLNLDGSGRYQNETGVGFLDHMLDAFARHGDFDLTVQCKGDLEVDAHHTVEDVGLVLGQAIYEALGDKKGICRYGLAVIPMDEALVQAALDISGRSYLGYEVTLPAEQLGNFETELGKEFFLAVVREAHITLHIDQLHGENSHHILEAAFKAFARALREACSIDPKHIDDLPSTKGML